MCETFHRLPRQGFIVSPNRRGRIHESHSFPLSTICSGLGRMVIIHSHWFVFHSRINIDSASSQNKNREKRKGRGEDAGERRDLSIL